MFSRQRLRKSTILFNGGIPSHILISILEISSSSIISRYPNDKVLSIREMRICRYLKSYRNIRYRYSDVTICHLRRYSRTFDKNKRYTVARK